MKNDEKLAILIADLGYGDAGKGSIIDYLTRLKQPLTIIRYNGGAQAAHNVVTLDGKHHTFAQFGSGTFIPGTQTLLSRFMITHPLAMLAEERHLHSLGIADGFNRMNIDRESLITTPFHQAINRLKEIARGGARHGSCGMGVGETMSDWLKFGNDVLFAGDLGDRPTVIKKLSLIRDAKVAELEKNLLPHLQTNTAKAELNIMYDLQIIETTADIFSYFASLVNITDHEYFEKVLRESAVTLFEGAQGVLLDEWYGFYPYNSWSTLSFKNADSLLSENRFDGQTIKLGLMRGYATRHGAGPFVTEDGLLMNKIRDYHNKNNDWQCGFRVGYLDFIATRYALKITGQIDGLVVTNLDRMNEFPAWQTCNEYQTMEQDRDLREYFDLNQRIVSDIKLPADPTNLDRQARLTQLLFKMQPVYSSCEKDPDAYLEYISQTLNSPIVITSHGPTAQDKSNFMSPSKNHQYQTVGGLINHPDAYMAKSPEFAMKITS